MNRGSDRGARIRDRLRRGVDLAWQLTANAVPRFFRDRCPQLAAAIAFFALLSVFPLAIVLTAGYGLVAADPGGDDAVIDFIVQRIPLSEGGTTDLRAALDAVTSGAGRVGAIGLIFLVFTASALMAAVRHSVNAVFGVDEARPPLRGKLIDVALVFALGSLFALSLATALLGGIASETGEELGIPRSVLEGSFAFVSELIPILLAAVVFAIALVVVPARRRRLSDIWPGVLVATLGYELVQVAFSIYLENFGRYSAVYGSLGAVIAFMVFVYLAAMAFMLGAEYADLWPRARAGDLKGEGPSPPFREQLGGWIKRLAVNPERRTGRRSPDD